MIPIRINLLLSEDALENAVKYLAQSKLVGVWVIHACLEDVLRDWRRIELKVRMQNEGLEGPWE